jgi:hypothetical protein
MKVAARLDHLMNLVETRLEARTAFLPGVVLAAAVVAGELGAFVATRLLLTQLFA